MRNWVRPFSWGCVMIIIPRILFWDTAYFHHFGNSWMKKLAEIALARDTPLRPPFPNASIGNFQHRMQRAVQRKIESGNTYCMRRRKKSNLPSARGDPDDQKKTSVACIIPRYYRIASNRATTKSPIICSDRLMLRLDPWLHINRCVGHGPIHFTPRGIRKGTSFLLRASFLILDRNWWIFSRTLGLRKVDR